MSENPKDDDWGMTTPNLRLNDEKKNDRAPKFDAPSAPPPVDDWGMTQANVDLPKNNATPFSNQPPSQPFSDFDKTAANINVPSNFSESPKQSPPLPPQDDWGITQANVQLPKDDKRDDWKMPSPVFRVSSGEKPSFDKTSNFNLRNQDEDFGSGYDDDYGNKTTPYYRMSENQAPEQSAPVEPPPVSEQFTSEEMSETPVAKAESGNLKWVLLLGGLFVFFLVTITGIVAVYLLYFSGSSTVRSVPANKTEPNVAPNTAPSVAPTAAPVSVPQTATLPPAINYKSEMVLVAAGEFTMGSDTGGDESKPAHKVTLPAFYIDKYEVTNAQYKEFCRETGKTPPPDPFWEKGYFENRPNAPVLGVSYDEAKAFAEWAGKRLPTEAEWEKAASWNEAAQSKSDFPWGASFESGKAAFSLDSTRDVGSFTSGASPSGAMDLAGNVAEWVDAFFQPYPGNTSQNPNFGEINRVVRGGHFGSKNNDLLKTTKRIYVPPTVASGEDEEKLFAAAIGFRCAVSSDDARVQDVLRK